MRGLSFIEVLVVLAIFSLIMVAIVDSVIFFYKANTSSLEQGYQIENARRGNELLVRDVREATYGDNGAYPLAAIATSSVTFYSDTDSDGAIEQIRYYLVGTVLYRNVTDSSGSPPVYTGMGTTTTVSQYVRNTEEGTTLFRYYDATNSEVTDPALIKKVLSVSIILVVDIVQRHAPGRFTLKGSATLRNLRAQ